MAEAPKIVSEYEPDALIAMSPDLISLADELRTEDLRQDQAE